MDLRLESLRIIRRLTFMSIEKRGSKRSNGEIPAALPGGCLTTGLQGSVIAILFQTANGQGSEGGVTNGCQHSFL